jgi:hypothetical protein
MLKLTVCFVALTSWGDFARVRHMGNGWAAPRFAGFNKHIGVHGWIDLPRRIV